MPAVVSVPAMDTARQRRKDVTPITNLIGADGAIRVLTRAADEMDERSEQWEGNGDILPVFVHGALIALAAVIGLGYLSGAF